MKHKKFRIAWRIYLWNDSTQTGKLEIEARDTASATAEKLAKARFWTMYAGTPSRLRSKLLASSIRALEIESFEEIESRPVEKKTYRRYKG